MYTCNIYICIHTILQNLRTFTRGGRLGRPLSRSQKQKWVKYDVIYIVRITHQNLKRRYKGAPLDGLSPEAKTIICILWRKIV
jgi:hypothetical protein